MPNRTPFVSLAVVVLAFAGCGSTKNAATTTAATISSLPPGERPIQAATYTAKLAGFPRGVGLRGGAPNGSGLAVITISPRRELCWKFSQLRNVTAPTVARIFRSFPGGSGLNGLPLGHAYKSSGCVRVPAKTALLGLLEANPQEWYVSIHTVRFPGGAVRGPFLSRAAG